MLNILIQSLFFLCISTPIYCMNFKQSQIVRSMLNDNNEKLQNWDFGITEKPTRTKIQPLPQLNLHPLHLKTVHAYKKNNTHALTRLYTTVSTQTTAAKKETAHAYKTLNNAVKKNAQYNQLLQISITNKLIDDCVPLFEHSQFLLKNEIQEINYAFNLFNFIYPLAQQQKLITNELITDKINNFIAPVSPCVSRILQSCQYLQAITQTDKNYALFLLKQQNCSKHPEIAQICQFLINYGDTTLLPEDATKKFINNIVTNDNPALLLKKIAEMDSCPFIIQKLCNTDLQENEELLRDIYYILAELYHNRKEYNLAHAYYKKNTPYALLKRNCYLNAMYASIASAENFSTEDVNYICALRNTSLKYVINTLASFPKTNPKLSYNIGLFIQKLFTEKPEAIPNNTKPLLNLIDHLNYAHKTAIWNTEQLVTFQQLYTDIYILLSELDQKNNHHIFSLKSIKQALEYYAQYSNNPIDKTIFYLFKEIKKTNHHFYKANSEYLTELLHLMYNPREQKTCMLVLNNNQFNNFASSTFGIKLLPLLEQKYKTILNTTNKHQICCLIAKLNNYYGNKLKAYNYKRLLPQSSCYNVQSNTGIFSLDHNKDALFILHALEQLEQHKNDSNKSITKAACLFVLNELSVASFINTITTEKNISQAILELSQTPFCFKIMALLQDAALQPNNPLLPHINYILAELYFYTRETKKAHDFYKKVPKEILIKGSYKQVRLNAFNTALINIENFDENEINYLTSLVNNIQNTLSKIELTDPHKSYNIALLTTKLLSHPIKMNMEEKIALILNGLDHLNASLNSKYILLKEALKQTTTGFPYEIQQLIINLYYDLPTFQPKKYLEKILELNFTFHTTLSTLYDAKKDYSNALDHMQQILIYRSQINNDEQDNAIATILAQAKEKNIQKYTEYALLTKNILHFINNEPKNIVLQKNHALLYEFATSELFSQLLPYCEKQYSVIKQACDDILICMALSNKHNKKYDKACEYIDKLTPLVNGTLSLKAETYSAAKKSLSDNELELFLQSFVDTKKPSADKQNIVISLIPLSLDFFIKTEKYNLALNLIKKLVNEKTASINIITLASHITQHLAETKNAYATTWEKELNQCNFYNIIKTSSDYNYITNENIAFLLMNQKPAINYEKTIDHWIATLENPNILPEYIQHVNQRCGELYYDWATTMTHDTEKFTRLLDIAITNHKSSIARYKKAQFILQKSDNSELIKHALELLEENITKNDRVAYLSRLALTEIYCNYSSDTTRIPFLKKHIPLNINKAINYLINHNNQEDLLWPLVEILSGISNYIDESINHHYINFNKALELLNILIEHHGKKVDYIIQRFYLYYKLNQPKKALNDIDFLLNLTDLTNTFGITKAVLYENKINTLIKLPESTYEEILECVQQFALNCNKIIEIDTFPRLTEHTKHILSTNDMSKHAIDWCCYTAESIIIINNNLDSIPRPTEEQKKLADYLLTAAKQGNINVQLILLPYYNNIYPSITGKNYYEMLQYTHKGLTNPEAFKQPIKLLQLIDLLHQLIQTGHMVPYYILCDFYKKDQKKLEEIMLLSSTAQNHICYDEDTTDTVGKICNSCKDTFMPYITRCIKNKEKASLIDTFATFTFGSMCAQSNDADTLAYAAYTLGAALYLGDQKPNCKSSLHLFLGMVNYKRAVINEKSKNTIDLILLKESARVGYVEAIHKLAEIYIEGYPDSLINPDDFLPLLERLTLMQEGCSQKKSEEIYNKYLAVKNKSIPINIKSTIISTEERNQQIINKALEKNIIKDGTPLKQPSLFLEAESFYSKNNIQKGDELLKKALAENKQNACALMKYAFRHLEQALLNNNYEPTKQTLKIAFKYGLVDIPHTKTKQFCNIHFMLLLFNYIDILITENISASIKRELLESIKTTLQTNGVDLTVFREMFEDVMEIDLNKIAEWNNQETKNNENAINFFETLTTAKKNINQIHQNLKNINHDRLKKNAVNKNMIRHIEHKEISNDFLKANIYYEQGDAINGDALLKQVMLNDSHHPGASIITALRTLLTSITKKNYDSIHTTLVYALKNILVASATDDTVKQFYNLQVLETLFTYINVLVREEFDTNIKQKLITTIKTTLKTNSINLKDFYELFEQDKKINLLSKPEWTEKLTLSKTDKQKMLNEIVQDMKDKNISNDFAQGLIAYSNGKISDGLELLHYAAETQHMPGAYILLAISCFNGEFTKDHFPKDLYKAEKFLLKGLEYGLLNKQFCNLNFFDFLCSGINKIVTNQDETSDIKRKFLSIIKKSFILHNINLTRFYDLFYEETKIDLTLTEWQDAEPKILEKTPEELDKENINNLLLQLIKNPEDELTPLAVVMTQMFKMDKKKECFNLSLAAAQQEHSPEACLSLSSCYLKGDEVKQNYKTAELYLKAGLGYGLKNAQFCSNPFLAGLFGYISILLVVPKIKKKQHYFWLIIKNALQKNNINLDDFIKVFEYQCKTKMSLK